MPIARVLLPLVVCLLSCAGGGATNPDTEGAGGTTEPVGGRGGSGGKTTGSGGKSMTGAGGTTNGEGGATNGTGGATSGTGGTVTGSGGVSAGGSGGNTVTGGTSGGGSGGEAAGGMGGSNTGGAGPGAGGATPTGNPFVYVGSGAGSSVSIFQLDIQSGALAAKGTAKTGNSPSYIAFHPSRKYLYVLNEEDPGQIQAFSINRATGALTMINEASSGGNGPAHLSVHPSGKWVFAANYNSGHVAVLPVDDQGGVGEPVDIQKPVDEAAHNVVSDPAGVYVFVSSTTADRIMQYKLNQSSGKLMANMPAFVSGMGQSPRHLAFHPNAQSAYVLGESGGSVTTFRYDAATGLLSNPVVSKIAGGSLGSHVAVHPSGKFVYGATRGGNILAGFTVGAGGALKSFTSGASGLSNPWDFFIEETGQYLLVANANSSSVKVFRIDQSSGTLTSVGAGASSPEPHSVAAMVPPP
jgi:6-phosphogluconolactonase